MEIGSTTLVIGSRVDMHDANLTYAQCSAPARPNLRYDACIRDIFYKDKEEAPFVIHIIIVVAQRKRFKTLAICILIICQCCLLSLQEWGPLLVGCWVTTDDVYKNVALDFPPSIVKCFILREEKIWISWFLF